MPFSWSKQGPHRDKRHGSYKRPLISLTLHINLQSMFAIVSYTAYLLLLLICVTIEHSFHGP